MSRDSMDTAAVLPVPQGPVPDPVETLYNELRNRILELRPKEDLAPLDRAFRFAKERHGNQKRESGEPYMIHPLLVTRQLADMNMDMVCLQTGLLHDVVEDTGAKLEDVRKDFGDEVARCVDGVTKLSKLNLASREERQAESVRKMLLAMVGDLRVILVKLADRLHNMRTLELSSAGEAASHRPGDHRHLRAHRAPAGDGKDPRRAGGSGVPLSGAGSLRGAAEGVSGGPRSQRRRFSRRSSIRWRCSLRARGFRPAWKAA